MRRALLWLLVGLLGVFLLLAHGERRFWDGVEAERAAWVASYDL